MNYTDKNTKELLEIYNDKAEKPLKQWNQSKQKLITRIRLIGDEYPAKKKTKAKTKTKTKARGKTSEMRPFIEKKILEVAKTQDGVKLGHSYSDILKAVKKQFPEASTSLNCLRWYSSKLNKVKGTVVPPRPRGLCANPAGLVA